MLFNLLLQSQSGKMLIHVEHNHNCLMDPISFCCHQLLLFVDFYTCRIACLTFIRQENVQRNHKHKSGGCVCTIFVYKQNTRLCYFKPKPIAKLCRHRNKGVNVCALILKHNHSSEHIYTFSFCIFLLLGKQQL